jgi:hypothetical protein
MKTDTLQTFRLVLIIKTLFLATNRMDHRMGSTVHSKWIPLVAEKAYHHFELEYFNKEGPANHLKNDNHLPRSTC